MSLLTAFRPHIPIVQAELTFQQRSSGARRRRRLLRRLLAWPGKILLALAVMSAVVLLVVEPFVTAIGYDLASLPAEMHNFAAVILFFIPLIALIPLTLLIHFRTQLRTLALASNSISREKRGGTWDLLLLTPVSAREIVRGKWWATLKYVWRGYALLTLLRVASLFWLVQEAGRYNIHTYPTYRVEIQPHYYPHSALHLLLAASVVALLTMLNAGYTSALGTLGSVFNRGGGTSLTLAIAIRTVTLIAIGAGIMLAGHLLLVHVLYKLSSSYDPLSQPWMVYQMLVSAGVNILDNGFIVAGTLASFSPPDPSTLYYGPSYYYAYVNSFVAGTVLALGLLIVLTWLSLRLAEWLIKRQGALRGQADWWDKVKTKKPEEAADVQPAG
jgi:hypothetical protein